MAGGGGGGHGPFSLLLPRLILGSPPLLCRLWTRSRQRGWGTATTLWRMRPSTRGCGRRTCTSRCQGRGRTEVESQEGPRSRRSRASCGGCGQWALKLPGGGGRRGPTGSRSRQQGGQCDWGSRRLQPQDVGEGGVSMAWRCPCQPHACSSRSAPGPATSRALGSQTHSTRSFGEACSPGPLSFVLGEPKVGRKSRDWALVMLGLLMRNLSEPLVISRCYYPPLTNEDAKAPMGYNLTK